MSWDYSIYYVVRSRSFSSLTGPLINDYWSAKRYVVILILIDQFFRSESCKWQMKTKEVELTSCLEHKLAVTERLSRSRRSISATSPFAGTSGTHHPTTLWAPCLTGTLPESRKNSSRDIKTVFDTAGTFIHAKTYWRNT